MTHSFPTSPAAQGEQRKFINPTPGWVGANVFGPDGKPTAVAVEPGGEVWLTEAEERMTAEAPRNPADNPFTKQWDEPVGFDSTTGEVTDSITREGTLVLADEPARPIASSRFTVPRAEEQAPEAQPEPEQPAAEPETEIPAQDEETIKGAPEIPEQPPVEGQPSPDEVVGTPEAKAANDEALAERESTREQPTRRETSGAIAT